MLAFHTAWRQQTAPCLLFSCNKYPPQQESIAADVPTNDTDERNLTGTNAPKRGAVVLAGRLEKLMETNPLYLNPELTMDDLTRQLYTNRTYMSEYFSAELGTTFYDYINRLRIERMAIPLMESDKQLSLGSIAEQSGFKSMTTFRRAFQKVTGQLPSSYMRR